MLYALHHYMPLPFLFKFCYDNLFWPWHLIIVLHIVLYYLPLNIIIWIPCRNVVSFSDGLPDEGHGIPYFYLTTLDPTARNALSDQRSSLTISEYPIGTCGKKDPENPSCAKITLTGKVCWRIKCINLLFMHGHIIFGFINLPTWFPSSSSIISSLYLFLHSQYYLWIVICLSHHLHADQ